MNRATPDISQQLAAAQFVRDLPEATIRLLAAGARPVSAGTGTVLFEEGTHCDEIFVVLTGNVALEMNVPRRGRVRLLTVGEGELLGWSGLVGDGCMTATAVVTSEATLVALSARRLRELSEQDYEFGFALMRQTARAVTQRLLATRLQLLDLFSETESTAGHAGLPALGEE